MSTLVELAQEVEAKRDSYFEALARLRAYVAPVEAPVPATADRPRRLSVIKAARKSAPPQLCPVPGCDRVAAPAYGMVCGAHKGVAKSKIKKYREARRARKQMP
jgi:hypothetical protein